ncbi:MAG: RNA-binding protein [Opitutae bacterium]|jgi:RNA recognition motif-containing protein|nr:RNA-binding protein [Opitutae bacterium]MBT4224680.1 RNA-binding protein [Opitutae bacterium]MBT5378730.1 RNA-binding protein [Opitutae bacterium]MBT5692437.1 RNA-binding protein [Opitutae bacterium]MBT6463266.1 RNA-binding protein [Opitutae bacterium]
MNIYIGNLSYNITDQDLQKLFEEYGKVDRSNVISDRETGRSKGFGFIEMPDQSEGQKAIEELDGQEVDGRNIRVNEARPKEDRPRRDNW